MSKRFNQERLRTRQLWLGLLSIGGVLSIPIFGGRLDWAGTRLSATVVEATKLRPALTARQLKARDEYWASKQGLTGGVPIGAFASALRQVNEEELHGALRKLSDTELASAFSWRFLGPDPISLMTYFTTGVVFPNPPQAHSGAGSFSALAVDSSGNIFAGSADGGVYLSSDGGDTFSQIFDGQPTEAIGAIAIDTTTNPNTVYVGTGNPNGSFDSYYGAGVFRSTDLGSTWTEIMPAAFANAGVAVSKIALDPAKKIIFVGATWGTSSNRAGASDLDAVDVSQAGLWVSTDDGVSFAQEAPTALGDCYIFAATVPCPVDDVEIDPEKNSSGSHNVYVAVDAEEGIATNSGGVFRSADEGGTFTSLIPSLSRSSIAVGSQLPGQPAGQAYFMAGDAAGAAYNGFYYSKDGGASAPTLFTPPSFTSNAITFDGNNAANQTNSFYDQALTVYPSPPASTTAVFFGGVGLYRSGSNGSSFQSLINTENSQSQGPAANQHALAYDVATGQMLLADDGGLYSFSPTLSSGVTFSSLNTTLDTTLVESVGPHPTNNGLVWAGFEGAGTEQYQGSAGGWYFPASEAGDGGFVMYDPGDTNYVYHTYSDGNLDTNVSFAYSSNGGTSWTSAAPSKNLAAQLSSSGDAGAAFYPPIAVDPTTPHRVFFGAHAVYVSNNGGTTWVPQALQDLTGGCGDGSCALEDLEPVSHSNGWALAMADPFLQYQFLLANTASLNEDTGNSPNGGTWSSVMSGLAGAGVNGFSTQATGIAVDHVNTSTAYLSLGGFYGGAAGSGVGHIYKTTDFGNTWVEADGGTAQENPPSTALPDVPVLRVLVDSADTTGNTLYAATDIGVFKSSDGGNTWGSFNLGILQAIPVFDIEENQNNAIFIGTHGKGVFQLVETSQTPTPTPGPSSTATPAATPTPALVAGVLAISPASITFPTQAFGKIGDTSPPKTITVTNPKKGKISAAITITNVSAAANDSNGTYAFVNDGCEGKTLQPLQKCTITVTYTPTAPGKSTGAITIGNDSSTKPSPQVKLAGTGAAVPIVAKPAALNFGKATTGTHASALATTLTNKNNVPVSLTGENPGGKFPGDFQVDSGATTCGATLDANSSCQIGVTFSPVAAGARAATLVISGTIKNPVTIKLSGTGE